MSEDNNIIKLGDKYVLLLAVFVLLSYSIGFIVYFTILFVNSTDFNTWLYIPLIVFLGVIPLLFSVYTFFAGFDQIVVKGNVLMFKSVLTGREKNKTEINDIKRIVFFSDRLGPAFMLLKENDVYPVSIRNFKQIIYRFEANERVYKIIKEIWQIRIENEEEFLEMQNKRAARKAKREKKKGIREEKKKNK